MWPLVALGVLQGLTEFLPISSSGHLVLVKHGFHVTAPGAAMEIALHGGTLLAIIIMYRERLASLLRGGLTGDPASWRLLAQLAVASLPAAVVGYTLGSRITGFFTLSGASLGFLLTSFLLWMTPASDYGERHLAHLRWSDALWIGIAQALALWPGLSRSGSTIVMGRTVGLDPASAAEFSFLMAIPVTLGAMLLSWPDMTRLAGPTPLALGLGMLASAVTGLFAIKWVKRLLLHNRTWRLLGFYTLGLALLGWFIGG